MFRDADGQCPYHGSTAEILDGCEIQCGELERTQGHSGGKETEKATPRKGQKEKKLTYRYRHIHLQPDANTPMRVDAASLVGVRRGDQDGIYRRVTHIAFQFSREICRNYKGKGTECGCIKDELDEEFEGCFRHHTSNPVTSQRLKLRATASSKNKSDMHTKDKNDPSCEHNDPAHGNGAIGRP